MFSLREIQRVSFQKLGNTGVLFVVFYKIFDASYRTHVEYRFKKGWSIASDMYKTEKISNDHCPLCQRDCGEGDGCLFLNSERGEEVLLEKMLSHPDFQTFILGDQNSERIRMALKGAFFRF